LTAAFRSRFRIALVLAEGKDVTEIATVLGSATDTIRWHLKNLRAKTGCSRVGDVAMLALRVSSPLLADGSRAERRRG
jgi:DNA-binding CsgD family transcriptional regulator